MIVTPEEAQLHLPELLEAALRGEKIVITKNGKDIAQIVPLDAPHRRRKAGSARGQIVIHNDFDEPLVDFNEYMT